MHFPGYNDYRTCQGNLNGKTKESIMYLVCYHNSSSDGPWLAMAGLKLRKDRLAHNILHNLNTDSDCHLGVRDISAWHIFPVACL